MLARAITLIESALPADQRLAGEVLDAILPHTGNSLRVGITGSPGVGKSTFIEAFGKALVVSGKKIAVLSVDPSSQLTGGSILGDKTRMPELARDRNAFIRPSPAGQTLGGVARHTRETILLCEAAGFNTIIIETVGTGQSEIAIKSMVDFFLLLMQPGSGDALQGIKKGIVEMADAVIITKADGENMRAAKVAAADFRHALHLQQPNPSGWVPPVMACSALENTGLREIESMLEDFKQQLTASGHFDLNRFNQRTAWFHDYFNYLLASDPPRFQEVREAQRRLETHIQQNAMSPRKAAQALMNAYRHAVESSRPANESDVE